MESKDLRDLEDFSRALNDEYGEYLDGLLRVYSRRECASDAMADALSDELTNSLSWCRENLKWEDKVETITHKYRVLIEK